MSGYVFSLSPRKTVDEEDDWDRYSENIRPTRKGRKVEALRHRPEVITEASAIAKLDDILDNLDLTQDIPDALSSILDFCSWFENVFTIGHHKLYYQLLWKVVNKDGFLQKYSEDERLLKFWEKLADNSAGHGHDIFQFAIARKSLIRCAALYIQWSQCVEMANAFVEARRVLLLAKANCAVPLEDINKAEDELEMREMRRNMDDEDDEIDDDEETRKAFTRLQTMGEHNEAPIVRLPSLVADPNQKLLKLKGENTSHQKMQPFEVFVSGNADDVEYLMGVHELDAHIERYAMNENQHPKLKDVATTSTAEMKPIDSGFNVWSVDAETSGKTKAKLGIKPIFKTMSFEEYVYDVIYKGGKKEEEEEVKEEKNIRRKLF